MWKKLVIVIVVLIFIDPIYTASKAAVKQIIAWTENEDIEDILLVAKDKITEVTATISDNAAIEKATFIEEEPSEQTATAPITSQPEVGRVVTNAQEMADAMYVYYSSFAPTFEIQYKGNTQRIEQIVEEAYNNAIQRDDYVYGHMKKHAIRYEYGRNTATILGEQSYLMTPEQAAYVDKNVQAVVDIIKQKSSTAIEKVRAVNDYIVSNTVYTEQTKSSPHSAYTVLAEHSGVCQGYALLAHAMLTKLGIETQYVVGYVGQEGHAWNLVKLDEAWYHLDTTWNDPVPDRKGAIRYRYFLVDDRTMAEDHTWIVKDYPKATSTQYQYYHQVDFATQVDQQLFYSNTADDSKLYVLDLTTGKSKRVSNTRVQYIVYADGWLYYSNYSHGAYLTKIRPDGSDEQLLNREDTKDLFVKDGYLYFMTNEQKRMAL
ncbi:transglutaminase domain-containing protein [Lysinibacillus piscis]|uniref:Transglutaminase-like domain-containing protein n=1 Tax=Lysinibacillus piscis TaxID=2518931 RepID=A0ABQ5NP88_9BACI|nr:transglutaminase domain-containing protein [Lysinibacillus sp. KH24]GLC90191.1 hypothetical protein LYSBPC_33180 [Lysinibacillus sp. KH24]